MKYMYYQWLFLVSVLLFDLRVLLLLVFFLAFKFLVITPNKKKQQEVENLK